MKKLAALFLTVVFFLSFSEVALAGKVTIGGVNIDGRQYGGIHSESGRINGPIHQNEEFHMNGGRMDYLDNSPNRIQKRDNIFVPNIEIDEDQNSQVEDTPISEVLRNVYDYIGRCKVYREEGRIKIMVGKIGPESPSAYLCKAIEDFCLGTSKKEISFQDEKNGEWILLKSEEGDVFIKQKESP